MLALDSTIGCIEVSESDVLDLYRSAPINRSSEKRTETMEAYICAIRRKTLVKVYLALVVNDQRIYVYSSPGKGKGEQEYAGEVEKSLNYATAMGFSPERVDLSYSPAMREVVVRNTKILRLPGAKGASLKHGLTGAPVLPMLRQNAGAAPEPEVAVPAPVTIPAPAAAPPGAPVPQESQGGELLAALAKLQHEQQALTAERDALAKQLQQLSTQHQETVKELTAARKTGDETAGEIDAMRSRHRQADEFLAAKESVIAELQKQAADQALELEALATQNAELEHSRDAMLENLAQARQDIAALSAQRDAALEDTGAATQQHRETAAQLDRTRLELERSAEEAATARQRIEALEVSARSLEQELAALRQELAGVSSERDSALQRVAAESADRDADADLERLRQELEQVAAERDTALARLSAMEEQQAREAQETQAQLRREPECMAGERDAARQRVADLEEHQEAEPVEKTEIILPPFSELQAPPEMGHPWVSAADVAESTADVADSAADVAESAPPVGSGAGFGFGFGETAFVPLGELQGGFFTAAGDDAPVLFLLETGLDAIDCPAAENVLELHQSINNAYLSPEGTGGQESCQGYICCLRQGDEKTVFAAIYGTKSHRCWVYLPESQPGDEDSYARTVRSAISFAEEVGLMMERVTLEATGPKRQERLKRCPVLRLAEKK